MSVRYEPDRAGLAMLARSAEMQQVADAAADAGVDYARSIAPVDSGAYRDSIHRVSGDGSEPEAYVASDDPGAIVIERGDGRTRQGHYTLTQTAAWIEGD